MTCPNKVMKKFVCHNYCGTCETAVVQLKLLFANRNERKSGRVSYNVMKDRQFRYVNYKWQYKLSVVRKCYFISEGVKYFTGTSQTNCSIFSVCTTWWIYNGHFTRNVPICLQWRNAFIMSYSCNICSSKQLISCIQVCHQLIRRIELYFSQKSVTSSF